MEDPEKGGAPLLSADWLREALRGGPPDARVRMPGLGAYDRLRPAARVRVPVSLRTLISVGFQPVVFYVRGVWWSLWFNAKWALSIPTHLCVTIQCMGPNEGGRQWQWGWQCAARGYVRVLRGAAAGDEVAEERTFDHTFVSTTNQGSGSSWTVPMPWRALEAYTEGQPEADFTDELITVEVEMFAEPPSL